MHCIYSSTVITMIPTQNMQNLQIGIPFAGPAQNTNLGMVMPPQPMAGAPMLNIIMPLDNQQALGGMQMMGGQQHFVQTPLGLQVLNPMPVLNTPRGGRNRQRNNNGNNNDRGIGRQVSQLNEVVQNMSNTMATQQYLQLQQQQATLAEAQRVAE